jgi:bifunctional UDP-N-acetylglucosamine pyrophosphorylase/glucosamine-1-phosphate N-acetyltransferase
VQQAQGALADFAGDVLILYGDVPFVRAQTMQAMLDRLHAPMRPPWSCWRSSRTMRCNMAG